MSDDDRDDDAVIRRVLAGDRECFSVLVDKYSQAIHGQMRHYAGDARASEELAHEVFVEAYLNLAKYRGDSPFFHWLSRIATFTGRKHWRTRARMKGEVEFSDARDAALPETPLEPGDAEQAGKLAYEMLATLPDNDRIVLTLAYLEGCSHDEIARRLGWSKTLIAMRLFKAKGKLRKLAGREPWKGRVRWMTS